MPIDFEDVIYGEKNIFGYYIGSSYRLQTELIFLAEKIELALDTFEEEVQDAWENPDTDHNLPLWKKYSLEAFGIYQLYHGAKASIEKKAALVFV